MQLGKEFEDAEATAVVTLKADRRAGYWLRWIGTGGQLFVPSLHRVADGCLEFTDGLRGRTYHISAATGQPIPADWKGNEIKVQVEGVEPFLEGK